MFRNTIFNIQPLPFRFELHNVYNGTSSNSSFSNRGFVASRRNFQSNEEMSARSALLCNKRSRDYSECSNCSESGRAPAPFVMGVCLINSHRIASHLFGYDNTRATRSGVRRVRRKSVGCRQLAGPESARPNGIQEASVYIRVHIICTRENRNAPARILEGPFI